MCIRDRFRTDLKGLLKDTILSERSLGRGYFRPETVRGMVDQHNCGRRDYAHQLWTLLMLEMWHQEFID